MRLISKYGWIRTLHVATLRAKAFMRAPWAGGVVLLACVVAAMLLANLPATKIYYRHLLETELSVMVHSPTGVIDWIFPRGMNVEKLINDGLMVVFFFAVGLEIKREVVRGQLSSFRQAILPVVAAAGGMIAPAVVFTLFNHGTPAASGWGIPTATDIAFAVGILSMLERRIPVSLKIFLMALAVADDLGAILVIAFFLRRRGPAGLPRAGAGDHARRLCDEAARGETHGLLSRSRRGRLEPVLLFGRPLDHFGRGDGAADPDGTALRPRVFRAEDAPAQGVFRRDRKPQGRIFPTRPSGPACAVSAAFRPRRWV